MQQLRSPEFDKEADPEILHAKFVELQRKFHEFGKLTNAGKASPELRTKKLRVLSKWLEQYTDPASVAIQHLPQKYKNKNVVLDKNALREIAHFKSYINHIMTYMSNLDAKYQEVKDVVFTLMEKDQTLQKHMGKFIVTQEDIPSYDLLAADDKPSIHKKPPPVYNLSGDEPTVSPAKMLKTIQTILNQYHSFSVKVAVIYKEISALVDELDSVDLGKFFKRTNQRNKLIQALLGNLAEMNRIIYQEKLSSAPLFREKYYQLVEECAPLLPAHIERQLLATIKPRKGKGQFQEAIDSSLQGLNTRDPAKDPAMKFVSPHVKNYTSPEAPEPFVPGPNTMQERIDRTMRFKEIEDAQRAGAPIDPTQKAEYEKLWHVAQQRIRIMKLAKFYQSKI